MAKARKGVSRKGKQITFDSLDDLVTYIDEKSGEAAETRNLVQQVTGFAPGQPLDSVGVLKVLHKVLKDNGILE